MWDFLADDSKRLDETAQLLGAQPRRLSSIAVHVDNRDAACAYRQRQRIVAWGEYDTVAAQREGRSQKGDSSVAGVENAQIVVTIPCPQHQRRQVDALPVTKLAA